MFGEWKQLEIRYREFDWNTLHGHRMGEQFNKFYGELRELQSKYLELFPNESNGYTLEELEAVPAPEPELSPFQKHVLDIYKAVNQ